MKRIFLFLLVNILVVVTISIVASLLGVNRYMGPYGLNYGTLAGFCLVWGMGGAFISLALSRVFAKFAMGVSVINPAQCTSEEQALYQLVSQLAYKANLPATPEVGVYESDEFNAFATGPTKRRSLVAVSRGLLEGMNRTEVEGVLAHEIAHIANGDMVTMTLLQGVINAFVMFFARVIAFFVTQAVREETRPLVNMVVVIALEIVFSLFGMLVVAWFSRQREFRADAGGARLAGKTGMISALVALKQYVERMQMAHEEQAAPQAPQAVATLQISNPRGGWFALFATHPPLEDRIAALRSAQQN